MPVRKKGLNINVYNAPNIYKRNQKSLFKKLAEFNDVIPFFSDIANQRAVLRINNKEDLKADIDFRIKTRLNEEVDFQDAVLGDLNNVEILD